MRFKRFGSVNCFQVNWALTQLFKVGNTNLSSISKKLPMESLYVFVQRRSRFTTPGRQRPEGESKFEILPGKIFKYLHLLKKIKFCLFKKTVSGSFRITKDYNGKCKTKSIQGDLVIFRNYSGIFRHIQKPGIFRTPSILRTRGIFRPVPNISDVAFRKNRFSQIIIIFAKSDFHVLYFMK